jgi:protease I
MSADLSGMKVAILVTNGYEQVEFEQPRAALQQAGATTMVISPQDTEVKAWELTDWGNTIEVDLNLDSADGAGFDALLLPGGVLNPDSLRMVPEAVQFVEAFFEDDKPVAAICHGPVMLIEADVVEGRELTSYPSIRTDLENAGADWIDQETVLDGKLLTSRRPDDIRAFNREMIKLFAEYKAEAGGGLRTD